MRYIKMFAEFMIVGAGLTIGTLIVSKIASLFM